MNYATKNNIFYILIFFIILFCTSIYLFLENSKLDGSECLQYSSLDSYSYDLDKYIDNNPLSVRNKQTLVELDLFPDINSLRCLGVKLNIPSESNFDVITTSSTLLNLVVTLSVLFTYFIFIYFQKNSYKYFGILMIFYLINSMFIFYGSFKFNFNLLIFPLGFLFFSILLKDFDNKNLNFFIIVNVILLIFNYNFFTKILPLSVLVYFKFFKNLKLNKAQNNLITIAPIFYYFLRQISGKVGNFDYIWQYISSEMYRGSPRFADMYYTFAVINCNKTGCGFKNNYGPLWEYLAIDLNPKVYTLLFSVLLITISQIFYYLFLNMTSSPKKIIIFFIYVSPPTSFLMERMNFDIFVVVIGYLALLLYLKGFKNISLVIITLLTMVKIFPIMFFLAISIYEFVERSFSSWIKSISFIIVNAIIYIFYFAFELQSGVIANPYGVSWTFGILTDISIFIEFFGNSGLVFYLIIFLISIFLYSFYLSKDENSKVFYSQDRLIELSYLITFVIIGLYYNFDFRIAFFSMGLIYFVKNYNLQKLEIISLLFLTTSVSPYFELDITKVNNLEYFHSITFLVINQIAFNIIMIYLVIKLLSYFKDTNYFSLLKFSGIKNKF